MSVADDTPRSKPSYSVRLFIAGDSPNSRIARENLQKIVRQAHECHFEIDIVDVLKNPQLALDHGVYITPALQILSPERILVFGNLNDEKTVKSLFSKTNCN